MRLLRRVLNWRLPWLIAAAGLMPASATAQQQPSAEPVLRLETGMHTARITGAATDAAGRVLATASLDKTLRLWSLDTGELIRVLRPPLGGGDEGKLYAVAMSPDGRFVATGGWTGYEWEKTHSIYVFEVASSRLIHRVGGLPNVTDHLAWSPDGAFVVATLGGANGIRVYRASDWQEVARDTDYADESNGAFDRSGRLAAVASDGYVRLYDQGFRRIRKAKARAGVDAFSVAFSPDGSELAVGFEDTTNVDVFSVRDLRRVFSPDTSGLSGTLSRVAWTADGALLAGGTAGLSDITLFRWPRGGRGKRQGLAATDNTVTALVPLAGGGFVYASYDPASGVYDQQLRRRIDRRPEIIDFRGQLTAFRLWPDGTSVAFGLEESGGSPVWFDTNERHLGLGTTAENLDAADTTSLAVGGWEDEYAPKLAGKPLGLDKYERSRSLAIAPDRGSFLLGAEWSLRRVGSDGTMIWSVPVPGAAWAVNVSRDRRLAVVALGDGTIRWYRYEDGKELLALFVHRDGRRWVLWTPEGYYDASPGGEDLIGWHVNRGRDDAADFFPASRFRDRFYRPAAVGAVLRTLDIAEALRQTASHAAPNSPLPLPPVVTILSPQEGEAVPGSTVEVHYLVRSPSGERVTSVQVLVDGRPLEGQRGVPLVLDDGPAAPQAERAESVVVPLEHDETITLTARAGERAGEAANVRVLWNGEKPYAAPQGRLYLLAVGVSDYLDEALKLHYAAKDAADVAAAFKRQEGGLYREVVPRLLSDRDATRANIFEGLQWLEEKTTKHDVAMVFLSGHGTTDSSGEYYFLAEDSDPGKLELTAVPNSWLAKTLSHVAGKTLFFFDTCRSGSISPPDINLVANKLSSDENGLVVFAASTGREFAYEREEWRNGAFSKALIEALTGKADASTYRNGRTTVDLLDAWLEEEVKSLTKDLQHPVAVKPRAVRDFAVAEQK